ncbi:MAG: CDP-glycerol glycerophosphotransferase family protein [Gemmatimonadaceae bacterium]|jgi:hypothetical protein|nr:CDP-glycerol glycerophosphotransferase family protein [Gemmatimonadaceae bacterium]
MHTTRAPLAFLIERPEAFNHYLPVWRHLDRQAFDVLVLGEGRVHDEVMTMGRGHGLTMRPVGDALADGVPYRYCVTHHPMDFGDPPLIKRIATRNVRFMYTLGKAGWTFSDWNALYDLVLCYGPFQAGALAQRFPGLPVLQMGYPRFDTFFNTAWDDDALAREYGCDRARPTVAWLPTWGALSSVHAFADAIAELRAGYNVIVKLHPLQSANEPETVRRLEALGLNAVVSDERDNVPLFRLADYVLCDYGGSVFGALLTDRRILQLDVPGADTSPHLGADSPELQLRNWLPHLGPEDARFLPAILTDEGLWHRQRAVRRELLGTFVAPLRGAAGATAALYLRNLDTIFGAG